MYLKAIPGNTKYLKFRLYKGLDLELYLKERKKESITTSKTQYFLQNTNFKYISSLYPIEEDVNFNGCFELEEDKQFTFDYESRKYTFMIASDKVIIEEVKGVA